MAARSPLASHLGPAALTWRPRRAGSAAYTGSGETVTPAVMARMYGELPDGHLERLRERYRRDLLLFGYPWPGFKPSDAAAA